MYNYNIMPKICIGAVLVISGLCIYILVNQSPFLLCVLLLVRLKNIFPNMNVDMPCYTSVKNRLPVLTAERFLVTLLKHTLMCTKLKFYPRKLLYSILAQRSTLVLLLARTAGLFRNWACLWA